MRRSSSWFLGLLLAASLCGGCSADRSTTGATGASLTDSYRLAWSYLMMAGE